MSSVHFSTWGMSLRHVSVAYDGRSVLNDWSLEIGQGDFVAVLGPNGCGKSTLLRTMLGYLQPQHGTVLLGEDNLAKVSPRARAQAMAGVRQEDDVQFEFSVEDIVAMGRTPHVRGLGLLTKEDRRIVDESMQATDVIKLRERPVTEISGGERRRVMIARALAQAPKVILLDEPTSNLDLSYQYEMLALLRRLNRERGITVVLAIHQINLAAMVASTILLMNREGGIHAMGSPESVITLENVQAVYATPVVVIAHPVSGRPQVIPTYDFGV